MRKERLNNEARHSVEFIKFPWGIVLNLRSELIILIFHKYLPIPYFQIGKALLLEYPKVAKIPSPTDWYRPLKQRKNK